jgi:hypothetical protein
MLRFFFVLKYMFYQFIYIADLQYIWKKVYLLPDIAKHIELVKITNGKFSNFKTAIPRSTLIGFVFSTSWKQASALRWLALSNYALSWWFLCCRISNLFRKLLNSLWKNIPPPTVIICYNPTSWKQARTLRWCALKNKAMRWFVLRCRISNQIRFEKLARLVSKTNFSVFPLTIYCWKFAMQLCICNDSSHRLELYCMSGKCCPLCAKVVLLFVFWILCTSSCLSEMSLWSHLRASLRNISARADCQVLKWRYLKFQELDSVFSSVKKSVLANRSPYIVAK